MAGADRSFRALTIFRRVFLDSITIEIAHLIELVDVCGCYVCVLIMQSKWGKHCRQSWDGCIFFVVSMKGYIRHGGRLCTLIFSRLCTLIFSRLCTLTSSTLSDNLRTLTSSTLSDNLRNIGNSRAIEAVNFFSLVHPGALFLDLGSLLHPGRLLQVRKCDLYEVTSVMPSMLGRSIFLKWLSRPFACCFEPSSSSTFDAML